MTQTNRINWIDWAKFFGIYLVVLGHTYGYCELRDLIYTFHMPFFFALSGLTFKPRNVKEEILISTKRLLIPYLFFMGIGYINWIFKAFTFHPERLQPDIITGVIIKPILGTLFGTLCQTEYSSFVNIPLWFLPALFCMRVILSFLENFCIKNAIQNTIRTIFYFSISLLLIFVAAFINKTTIILPFSLQETFTWFIFFLSAYLFQQKVKKLPLHNKIIRLALSISFIFILLYLQKINISIDTNRIDYVFYKTLFYLKATIGTAASILFCSLFNFQQKNIFALIGRNTLSIMGIHAPIITLVFYFLAKTLGKGIVLANHDVMNGLIASGYSCNLLMLLSALVTLVICLVPCYIFERWFPRCIGREKKKK